MVPLACSHGRLPSVAVRATLQYDCMVFEVGWGECYFVRARRSYHWFGWLLWGIFMIHVAILMKPYVEMILSGRKTIESRLTKTARAPYGVIERGERIYFKQSAGPFRATAVVDEVLCVDGLTPRRVRRLKKIYNSGICGDDQFWEWKRDSNFVTLVWLREVEQVKFGPSLNPQRGIAWLTLDEKMDVYPECVCERNGDSQLPYGVEECDASVLPIVINLTAGNVRNSHVRVPVEVRSYFPKWAFGGATKAEQAGRMLTLELENGPTVLTDIVSDKGIFRARGCWREWFDMCGAESGDRVLLFPVGKEGHYFVRLAAGE